MMRGRVDTAFLPVVGAASLSLAMAGLIVREGPLAGLLPFALALLIYVAWVVSRTATTSALALIAVLTAFPILRLSAGSAPLYAQDLLEVVALYAMVRTGMTLGRFGTVLVIYVALYIPPWFLEVVHFGLVLPSTYGLLRNVLAVSAALLGIHVVTREHGALTRLLTVAAAGTIVTGVLATLQELAPTRSMIATFLNTVIPEYAPGAYKVYPHRAFAFFTAPTTLSGFFAIMLPLMLLGLRRTRGRHQLLFAAALAALGAGLVSTYSRQWLPATGFGVLVTLMVNPGAWRSIAALLVIPLLVFTVGSSSFNTSYLTSRFANLSTNSANVQSRLTRQQAFTEVIGTSSPIQIVFGRGFAAQEIVQRGLVDAATAARLNAGANDNVVFLEILHDGVAGALFYLVLLLSALVAAIIGAWRTDHKELFGALAWSLTTAFALQFFDNYLEQALFMKGLLWLVIGLSIGAWRRWASVEALHGGR